MTRCSATAPHTAQRQPTRLSAGLILLMAGCAAPVFADTPPDAKANVAAKAAPAAKPRPKADTGPAECVRTGQRVIAALARDDSGAANQFYSFYQVFKCSQQHLAQSFGCLVALQTQNPTLSNPSPEQVAQCWDDPSTIPVMKPQQPEAQPANKPK